MLLLVAAAVLPPTGHALEIRRSEQLTTVAAGETIDDTLIILGESVTVDGDVNGDVIALARRVIVRGTVGGDLVTGAESVTIEGDVNGNVLGFARTLELQQSRIGRNLYGFAQQVSAGADTQIDGNAAVFAEGAVVRGLVGIDLLSFARTLELGGSVNRDLNAFGERVTLLERARVGRNLTARLANADNLQTASGAVVGGAIDIRADEPPEEQRSRYLTAGFYLWRAAWLGAAFLTGLVALWAFPALRSASLGTGAGVLMTGGIGLVTAVVLPVLAVIACITIIGLPVGIVAFLAWLAGLYLAKIVFANVLGSLLFRSPAGLPHYAATLLAGLVVVMIAINLPFVGWLFNIVLTLIGLGMIVEPIWNRTARRGAMG
jgi:cytoskeletal protein CcmA (bactofilin family)